MKSIVAACPNIPEAYHSYTPTELLNECEFMEFLDEIPDEKSADIFRWLIDVAGADINAKDSFGLTPLLTAVCGMRKEHIEILLERGCDVSVKSDRRQEDALLICMSHFEDYGGIDYYTDSTAMLYVDIAEMLFKAGANPYTTNFAGETAADIAREMINLAPPKADATFLDLLDRIRGEVALLSTMRPLMPLEKSFVPKIIHHAKLGVFTMQPRNPFD